MAALVEHSFEHNFLLDEERLRKLREIIATRLNKRSAKLSPSFKVFRGDSYSYVTDLVDDVVKEDNDDWRRITRLEVFVEAKDDLELRLTFSSTGTELNIQGEERDEVFLLFSDLREYINNDVATSRAISRRSLRSFLPFLSAVIMIGFFGTMWYQTTVAHRGEYQAALISIDVQQKLNFIINDQQRRTGGTIWLWVVVVMITFVLFTTGALEKSTEFLFPSNVFLFGKRKLLFERKRRLLSNLLWIVLVGLCVSIVAGFVVWYVTGTH
jgi:hypothetical protein